MTWINRRFLIKILLLLGLIASGIFVFIHYDLYADFLHKERAIAFINSFHPYDELVFISLQILQVVVAPIPGELAGIMAVTSMVLFLAQSIQPSASLLVHGWLLLLPGCLACPWWKRP